MTLRKRPNTTKAGVEPALVQKAKGSHQTTQERDAALLAPPKQAARSSDPWAAGLGAAMDALNASYNSFVAQQNSAYAGNLKSWNSGQKHWRRPHSFRQHVVVAEEEYSGSDKHGQTHATCAD